MSEYWTVEWNGVEQRWHIQDRNGHPMATVLPGEDETYDIEYELIALGQAGQPVRFVYRDGSEEVRVV